MRTAKVFCLLVVAGLFLYAVPVCAQGAGKPGPPADEIQSALDAQHINFTFKNRPLRKVVKQLRTLTNLNLLYYPIPEEDIPITVELSNMTLRAALDAICKAGQHDLDFEVIQGAVVIADKPTLIILRNKKPVLPLNPTPEEAELLKKLDERLDFSFEDDTMKYAVDYLGGQAKVAIVAELPHEGEFPKIFLTLARVTLRQALFHLTGLKYNFGVFGNEIVVSTDVGLALRKAK